MKIEDYKRSIFLFFWCFFNSFVMPDLLMGAAMPELHYMAEVYLGLALACFTCIPYVLITKEFNALGKNLTNAESLVSTFVRTSPLVVIYLTFIILIWYPTDDHFFSTIIQTVQTPNWWQISVWAVLVYYIASQTAKPPYNNVITALLGLLAAHHLIKLYTWHRIDDGCHTDFDGYVECDNSYVQRLDDLIKRAASNGTSSEALIAAELYTMLAYCLIIYVVIALIKFRFAR